MGRVAAVEFLRTKIEAGYLSHLDFHLHALPPAPRSLNALIQRLSYDSFLLIYPFLKVSPLVVMQPNLLPFIPHYLAFAVSPRFEPRRAAAVPPCFPHERDNRLLLGPALFFGHVR